MTTKLDMFFQNEQQKTIFILNHMDGASRMAALNPPKTVYEDKATADKWKEETTAKVVDGEFDSAEITRAVNKISDLHSIMTYGLE